MSFDTLTIAPLPPEGGCIEDVAYGTKIPLDRNGRPIGRSLQEWTDEFGRKLIEYYGEGFRQRLNYERAERGMNPL